MTLLQDRSDSKVYVPKRASSGAISDAIDRIIQERSLYWRAQLERSAKKVGKLTVPSHIKQEVWEILNKKP